MLTKPAYNKNCQSTQPWVPRPTDSKSLNNRSSVAHNIVSHEDNKFSAPMIVGILDKKVTNRKKGIVEIVDLNHLMARNTNPDYMKNFNPHQFKRKNGVFSHLYDAAHRFGEDKPFKV